MRFDRYDETLTVKVVDETSGESLETTSVEACLLYEILATLQEIKLQLATPGLRRVA